MPTFSLNEVVAISCFASMIGAISVRVFDRCFRSREDWKTRYHDLRFAIELFEQDCKLLDKDIE